MGTYKEQTLLYKEKKHDPTKATPPTPRGKKKHPDKPWAVCHEWKLSGLVPREVCRDKFATKEQAERYRDKEIRSRLGTPEELQARYWIEGPDGYDSRALSAQEKG